METFLPLMVTSVVWRWPPICAKAGSATQSATRQRVILLNFIRCALLRKDKIGPTENEFSCPSRMRQAARGLRRAARGFLRRRRRVAERIISHALTRPQLEHYVCGGGLLK